jgi:cellulose synthase operon protein C
MMSREGSSGPVPPTGRVVAILWIVICAAALSACSKAPEEVEASAAAHLERNESRSAMVELKDLLQREPDRARARLLLGKALNDQDDYAGAESELRRAAKLGVGADDVASPLARAMLYQGRFAELLAEPLVDGARDARGRADVLERKANALLALSRRDEALPLLDEARIIAPAFGSASATLAGMRMDDGRLEEAKALLDDALRVDPNSATVHRALGRYHSLSRRPAEAATFFSKSADLAVGPPRDRQVQRMALAALVETELSQQRGDAAAAALGRLDALGQGRINYLLRARLDILKGDLSAARRGLETWLARASGDTDATLLLGVVTLMQGNTGQAEMHLNAVLASEPGNFLARQVLAQLRLQAGKPKEAVLMLEPVLKEASGNVVTLAVQASLAAGDRATALAMVERAAAAAGPGGGGAAEIARGFLLVNEPGRALDALPPTGSDEIKDVATIEGLRLAALLARNDVSSARALADELAVREKGNVAVQTALGDFYLQVRSLDRARAVLEQAMRLAPADENVVLRLARLDALGGQVGRAEARLSEGIQASPKSAALQAAIAELKAARGDLTAAQAFERRAQDLAPDNAQLRLREAQLRLGQGDAAGAQKAAAAAAQRAPENRAALRAQVTALLAGKDADGAIAVVQAAREARPDDVELLSLLAATQAAAGRIDAGLETAERTARSNPGSVPAWATAADLRLQSGDLAGARRAAEALRKIDPRSLAATMIEVEVLVRERKFADAATAVASANARASVPALAVREYLIRRDGQLPQPEAPLVRWQERRPDDLPVLMVLAEHRLAEKRLDDALRHYRRVLDLQPGNTVALNNAAWVAVELGDFKSGLEWAQRAYEASGGAAAVADTYGWALTRSGNAARGLEVLGKARQSGAKIPELDLHYSEALVALGRRDEARQVLDTLLGGAASPTARAGAEALRRQLTGNSE